MYSVEFQESTRRIEIVRRGFWSDADVARYMASVRQALSDRRSDARPFDILIDNSDAAPLSQAASQQFGILAREIADSPVRRVALVVPGGINRAQARRVIPPDNRVVIFTTHEDALVWLEADESSAVDQYSNISPPRVPIGFQR